MSSTVTCDACGRTDKKGLLQVVLPYDETERDRLLRGIWCPRWDACSPDCARALVDRYESEAGA